ncbi:phage minor head protein [Rhodoferax sp.]|uniref:phage head morphogenesis protein n=1 Tax=Rhodoferax sp. TaxID=50421 RepID=UPI0026321EC1|nr:phage minor head protein [Rhodoferax sp.]MDD5479686.1 phage minor head protein [Rhodoferax sp.]
MDKTDPAVLMALFGMPPKEAMAYLEGKGLRITFNWAEMLDEAHARAFTVAKAMRLDVLRDIRTGVLDALATGKTLRQFEAELTPLLQAKGWWGKQIVVDSQGQAQQVQLGSPHRLKTIYQTNLQSAFMAGRMQAQMAATSCVYLMYVAVMDGRTRASHAALDGKIWRKDDAVWASIYPPNGHNCRCRTRGLTEGQLKREGLSLSDPPDIVTREVTAGKNVATGELFRTHQTGVTVKDALGKSITMWVDPGFDSSPLAGHPMDKLLAKKAVDALGNAAGFDLVRQAVLSDTRMRAWRAFIENTERSGIRNKLGENAIQGQSMTVGILSPQTVLALAEQDLNFSPVLSVEDRLIVGKKAKRHGNDGDALQPGDWLAAPELLSGAYAYLDKKTGQLVLVYAHGTSEQSVQLVFEKTGAAASAYLTDNALVMQKVQSGRWEMVK